MPPSWQQVASTPTICITIRLPLVSRYFCRSIGVRGCWNSPKNFLSWIMGWMFFSFCFAGRKTKYPPKIPLQNSPGNLFRKIPCLEVSKGHTQKVHREKHTELPLKISADCKRGRRKRAMSKNVKNRRKVSKSNLVFSTLFDIFRAGQRTSKNVKKFFDTFRQFSRGTFFPAPPKGPGRIKNTTTC